MEQSPYFLFLDDERQPHKVTWLVDRIGHAPCELPMLGWVIVKNYEEFLKCISDNGIPMVVTFDHDLAEAHYAPENMKGVLDYDKYVEKTGFHCAKWLAEYCIDVKKPLPTEIYIHSMNPVGRENIQSIIASAKNTFNWL